MKSALPIFHRLLNWIVEPAKSIQRQDERRQARLASTIQLVAAVLVIPVIFIFHREFPSAYRVFILFEIIIGFAYGMGRTFRYRVASGITIILLALTPISLTFFVEQFAFSEISTIIISNCVFLLVCSLFFSLPILFAGYAYNLLSILLIISVQDMSLSLLAIPTLLNIFLSSLIIVAARHRNLVEKDRLSELSLANNELEIMQVHLEERVIERTQELQQAFETIQLEHEKLLKSERMAALGRLTAGIAHEINTPLAASRATLVEIRKLTDEYLNSLGDPQVTLEDYRTIGQEMLQSLNLTENGLERIAGFVRSIKTQMRDVVPRERIIFNAVPVIQESLLLVNHALRAANCKTTFDQTGKSTLIYGLPGQLSQMITNLVTNAIDSSTEKGGGLITLKLTTHSTGVDLLISDNGEGIPADILPKIFNLLFTTKPTGSGTGLGLTIVRDIMTNVFNGTIEVHSLVGEGTTFILHFPHSGENQIDT